MAGSSKTNRTIAMRIRIPCRFCKKDFSYKGAYSNHLRDKHLHLLHLLDPSAPGATPTDLGQPEDDGSRSRSSNSPDQVVAMDADHEYDVQPMYYAPPELEDTVADFLEPDDIDRSDDEGHYSDNEKRSDLADAPDEDDPSDPPGDSDPVPSTEQPIAPLPTVKFFPTAGRSLGEPVDRWTGPPSDWNPWEPFQNKNDFSLAKWLMTQSLSIEAINDLLTNPLDRIETFSFRSAFTLHMLVDSMDRAMGVGSWSTGTVEFWAGEQKFFYRDPVEVVSYLMRQACFKDEMIYAPRKVYTAQGERVYSDMDTADWWWDTQVSSFSDNTNPSSIPRDTDVTRPLCQTERRSCQSCSHRTKPC